MQSKNLTNLTFYSIPPEEAPMSLLLEADPSEANIRNYLENALCYVAEHDGAIVGVCVLNGLKHGEIELFNIAVAPAMQAKGIGAALLHYVIDDLRSRGVKRIVLGTGTFGYQLAFYQRAGFRVESIDKDFFIRNYDEPIFELGIQLKDMLRLGLDL
ncbi:GNAT family N-acetyltransferase [candidate division KSB1 bacterium]|nr:GNAT family N-acetyltransferase [candidate division KSB1 bacterium]